MNRVIVLASLSGDKEKLMELYSDKITEKDIICSLHKELNSLLKADEIYFVFSETAVLSTHFQGLILSALPIISILPSIKHREVGCFLLPLDEVKIPKGFDFSSVPLGFDISSLPVKPL